MSRKYKTVAEVIEELVALIAVLKKNGQKALPPERDLAIRTGSCLMTVRKALTVLEEKKQFRKVGRSRLLNEVSGKSGRRVSVAYITSGDEFPASPTYQRLERELQTTLANTGVELRSVYYGWHGKAAEWPPEKLRNLPDIIVFAGAPKDPLYPMICTLRQQCLVIGVDEDCIGRFDCLVALNNYQAGYLAGKYLIKSGCRRPAMNYCDKEYMPFYHRRDGFIDALVEAGLPTENCAYCTIESEQSSGRGELLSDAVEKICRNNHDGFFLFTDSHSLIVLDIIRKYHRVPDEFRLITLDAFGTCRQSHEPVSAVSHALSGIARRISEIAVAVSRGDNFEKINLVDAEFIPGTTLGLEEGGYV